MEGYLRTVGEQIRWKRARPVVLRELGQHLADQRDAFAAEGKTTGDAERLAVEEMGDPVIIGTELDRVHRPKPQWGLLMMTMALALVGGGLRIWAAIAGEAYPLGDVIRTAVALAEGTACLLGAYFLDYTWLLRHARWVYGGALVLGLLSLWLSPNINKASYYTRYVVLLYPTLDYTWLLRHARWVYGGALVLGLLSLWLSPNINKASYYTRYVVLLYPTVYAVWLYHCRGKRWKGLAFALLGGIPLAAVTCLAPYMMGLMLLMIVGLILLLAAAGTDWFGIGRGKTAAAVLGAGAALAGCAAWMFWKHGFARSRLALFLHPEADPLGAGYQAVMVRKTLAVSRWLGTGDWSAAHILDSYERTVPAWETDFLLTTMIYRLGWLPFFLLVLAAAGLLVWLFRKCLRQRNQAGRLIALSVAVLLGVQMICSVLMNLGYVLFAAAMPLIVGNLASVVAMGLIGLTLSVFREEQIAPDTIPLGKAGRRIRISFRRERDLESGEVRLEAAVTLPRRETVVVEPAAAAKD